MTRPSIQPIDETLTNTSIPDQHGPEVMAASDDSIHIRASELLWDTQLSKPANGPFWEHILLLIK